MTERIDSQATYRIVVKQFENNYTTKFISGKQDAIDLPLYYTKIQNELNEKLNYLQRHFPLGEIQDYLIDWKYTNNSKSTLKDDFAILKLYCEEKKLDPTKIATARAEFEAIQKVFFQIFHSPKDQKQLYTETIEDFTYRVSSLENKFCKTLPIEIAIKHFKVFVEQKNRSDNFYLSEPEFKIFIEQAFLQTKVKTRLTLKIGVGENVFVIKRFYEFFVLAASGYEGTTQCKQKYIQLVLDNFTNWKPAQLRNNFANRTKKTW